MQNPFTLTFSRIPDNTYIPTEQSDRILRDLCCEHPTEFICKITGVRGSGKTVLLAEIEKELRKEEYREKGWIVLDLNPARDMLRQTAAMLREEGFGSGVTSPDLKAAVGTMLGEAKEKGKRILFGIDEVSKTEEMTSFLCSFGGWLESSYPVFLVCTGLYGNMTEVERIRSLTFFRVAKTVVTGPLNTVRMAEMYSRHLNVDITGARELAMLTKGYAYAFQLLGVMYFNKDKTETLSNVISSVKNELYACSYEKIWDELTDGDRALVRILAQKAEYRRGEILLQMGEKSGNYSMYRDRLIKRGLVTVRQGYISLALPFFGDYINEYSL